MSRDCSYPSSCAGELAQTTQRGDGRNVYLITEATSVWGPPEADPETSIGDSGLDRAVPQGALEGVRR